MNEYNFECKVLLLLEEILLFEELDKNGIKFSFELIIFPIELFVSFSYLSAKSFGKLILFFPNLSGLISEIYILLLLLLLLTLSIKLFVLISEFNIIFFLF